MFLRAFSAESPSIRVGLRRRLISLYQPELLAFKLVQLMSDLPKLIKHHNSITNCECIH